MGYNAFGCVELFHAKTWKPWERPADFLDEEDGGPDLSARYEGAQCIRAMGGMGGPWQCCESFVPDAIGCMIRYHPERHSSESYDGNAFAIPHYYCCGNQSKDAPGCRECRWSDLLAAELRAQEDAREADRLRQESGIEFND